MTKTMCIAVQLCKFFSTIVNFIMSAFSKKAKTPERFEPAASRLNDNFLIVIACFSKTYLKEYVIPLTVISKQEAPVNESKLCLDINLSYHLINERHCSKIHLYLITLRALKQSKKKHNHIFDIEMIQRLVRHEAAILPHKNPFISFISSRKP